MNSSRASTIVSIELGTEIQQPENLNSANGILRILTFIFCARLLPPWTPGGENRPNAAQPRSASVNQDSADRLAARQKSRDLEQSSSSRNQFAILRRLCIADSPVQRKRHGFKFEPVSTAQSLSGADADEGAFRKRCRNIRLRIGSPTSPSVIPTGAPSALARWSQATQRIPNFAGRLIWAHINISVSKSKEVNGSTEETWNRNLYLFFINTWNMDHIYG